MNSRETMQCAIGRKLDRNEIVHHLDCNHKNNNINNLMIFKNQTDHINYHCFLKTNISKYKSVNDENKLKTSTISLGDEQKQIAILVSESAGRNENNQISISHGIRVLLDRELEQRKSTR